MEIREGLRYSKEHEWVELVDGNKAYIGITDFAQDALGDVVFIELPEVGAEINVGDIISNVESVKAASEIYSPVSGTIIEVNEALEVSPEEINENPYGSWIVVVEITDTLELENLMSADAYEKHCIEED